MTTLLTIAQQIPKIDNDTLQVVGTVLTLLISLAGLVYTIVRFKSEKDKLEAETAALYAELNLKQATRISALNTDLENMSEEIKKLRTEISKKETRLQEVTRELSELRRIIDTKDERIRELESLSRHQEGEIAKLRNELEQLKKPK